MYFYCMYDFFVTFFFFVLRQKRNKVTKKEKNATTIATAYSLADVYQMISLDSIYLSQYLFNRQSYSSMRLSLRNGQMSLTSLVRSWVMFV